MTKWDKCWVRAKRGKYWDRRQAG